MGMENQLTEEEIEKIVSLVKEIQYGSIIINIQDGKIIQIDKNEKFRLR